MSDEDTLNQPQEPGSEEHASWEAQQEKLWRGSVDSGGPHHLLSTLVGDWGGRCRLWTEPGKLDSDEEVALMGRPLLDGRFVLLEYQTVLAGTPTRGAMILGYDLAQKVYSCSWVDNWHLLTKTELLRGERLTRTRFGVRKNRVAEGQWDSWLELEVDDDKLTITFVVKPPDAAAYKGEQKALVRKTEQATSFHEWWKNLKKTGDICPVQLGHTRADLRELLGEPDDASTMQPGGLPLIFKYDAIEFHFEPGSDGRLFLIYNESEDGICELAIQACATTGAG